MIRKLFILAVVAIPFNSLYPIFPLGELRSELSAYIFLVVIAMFGVAHFRMNTKIQQKDLPSITISQPFAKMAGIMFTIIGISFLFNFSSMFGNVFHGRFPMEKFLTSTMTVGYGFVVAYVTYILSKQYNWHNLVIWPVGISVGLSAAFGIFEVMSWFSIGVDNVFEPISRIIHLRPDFGADDVGGLYFNDAEATYRARSLCFEPPALANFAGFAWPWAYAGIYSAPPRHRYIYKILWFFCTVLGLIANSRTSLVLLLGNILTLILLLTIYLPSHPKNHHVRSITSFLVIMGTIGAVAAFFANTDTITAAIFRGDNISNLSRYSMVMSGFKMFLKNPVWGFGFGQYGFHVIDFMPGFGYYSWEVRKWLAPTSNAWPPVFSVYARFAAELGIIGVFAWIGIWYTLARSVWRVTFAYQLKTGQLLPMSYPLIIGCYTALFSGIPMDSLRAPMMWITMGLACSYIYDVRSRLYKLGHPEAVIADS